MMSNWKKYKLSDLVLFQRGHDLTINNFIPGPYLVAGSNGPIGYHNHSTTKGPGLTLGRSGNSIGVAHYYEKDFWAHNTTLYSKQFFNCHPKFLYYLLTTLRLGSHNSGSAVPSLNRNFINPFEVYIPDYDRQQHISSILSSLDDKIELNRRMNQTLEQMATTLFKKYFVDDVDHDHLPEGWKRGIIKDITLRITKGTTPTTLKRSFVSSGINFLKVETLTESGTYDFSKLNFIDEETDKILSRSRIEEGDILFSIAGTLGRIAVVNKSILPANTNQALAIIRPNKDLIHPLFIYFYLKIKEVKEAMFSKAVQGVQANLSLGVLGDTELLIPSKDYIYKAFGAIEPLQMQIEGNEKENKILLDIRNSLLPKLMSGEIDFPTLHQNQSLHEAVLS